MEKYTKIDLHTLLFCEIVHQKLVLIKNRISMGIKDATHCDHMKQHDARKVPTKS